MENIEEPTRRMDCKVCNCRLDSSRVARNYDVRGKYSIAYRCNTGFPNHSLIVYTNQLPEWASQRHRVHWFGGDPEYERAYRRAQKRCRQNKRGIEFGLTHEEFAHIITRANGKCELSGIPFSFNLAEGVSAWRPYLPSLDRIDNNKGYLSSNCRLICASTNIIMSYFDPEDVYIMAQAYFDNIPNRISFEHLQAQRTLPLESLRKASDFDHVEIVKATKIRKGRRCPCCNMRSHLVATDYNFFVYECSSHLKHVSLVLVENASADTRSFLRQKITHKKRLSTAIYTSKFLKNKELDYYPLLESIYDKQCPYLNYEFIDWGHLDPMIGFSYLKGTIQLIYDFMDQERTIDNRPYRECFWRNELYQRANSHCEITGLPFRSRHSKDIFAPSIDRVNPKGPYSWDNCRLVCWGVNNGLHDWGEEVFAKVCRGLLDNRDRVLRYI